MNEHVQFLCRVQVELYYEVVKQQCREGKDDRLIMLERTNETFHFLFFAEVASMAQVSYLIIQKAGMEKLFPFQKCFFSFNKPIRLQKLWHLCYCCLPDMLMQVMQVENYDAFFPHHLKQPNNKTLMHIFLRKGRT